MSPQKFNSENYEHCEFSRFSKNKVKYNLSLNSICHIRMYHFIKQQFITQIKQNKTE